MNAEGGQVVSIAGAWVKRAAALLRDEESPDQEEERRAWNDRATLPPAARTATSPAFTTPPERGAS
jgi:hypothetical protein